MPEGFAIVLTWFQAIYFASTGIWPLIHMRSFLAVTGLKVDLWLVKTVGVIVTAIGATLALAAAQQQILEQTILLAVASAAGLAAIDVIYVMKRVIAPIYLSDAAIEVLLIAAWAWVWWSPQ